MQSIIALKTINSVLVKDLLTKMTFKFTQYFVMSYSLLLVSWGDPGVSMNKNYLEKNVKNAII